MITWLLAVTLLLFILGLLFEPDHRLKHYGNLIPGPIRWPIFGNIFLAPKRGKDDLKFRTNFISKYGPVCRFWAGNILAVLLSDPKDIEVLLKHPKEIKKPFIAYEFLKEWLGFGLIVSSGDTWFSRRKALTPAFHFKILEQFMDVFNRKAVELVEILKKQVSLTEVDMYKNVNKTTLDVISETAMGITDSVSDEEFEQYKNAVHRTVHFTMDRVAKPILYNDTMWKYFGSYKEQQKCMETAGMISSRVIQEKEKSILNEVDRIQLRATEEDGYLGIKPKMGSLDIMLRLKLDGNPAFKTNADVLEETNTLFFAGHDTTATSICFTLDLLARHQIIQEELFQEIHANIKNVGNITTSEVQSLPLMERVVKESLRLFPPVPVIGRHILEDLQLPSGYTIPAGSMVAIVIYHVHRSPQHFDNPEKFNPDNFLPDVVEKRHPFAYIPFSAGPRNCIGRRFALLEVKTILATVLLQFKVLPLDNADPEILPYGSVILQLEGGHKVKLANRLN